MSLLSSETITTKESQKEKPVLTKSKFAAILALQEVNHKIFGNYSSGILLEKIPNELPKNNKGEYYSDSFRENAKTQRELKRKHAKEVMGSILGESAMAISDEKLNELIERYNSAQSKKIDKCTQHILQGDVDLLRHELESLYKQFQVRRSPNYNKTELPWTIEQIVTAIQAEFDPENIEVHKLLLSSLHDPVRAMVSETPSLQQNMISLAEVSNEGTYYVQELGQFVRVFPQENEIEIGSVRVPLDTRLEGVPTELIWGTESSKQVDNDRMNIFKKIAEQKLVTLTHITRNSHRLLQIIKSRRFGVGGMYDRTFLEPFNFSDQNGQEVIDSLLPDTDWSSAQSFINTTMRNLSSSDIESNKYKNIGNSSSSHVPRYLPSAYIHNGSMEPIFIFDAVKMKEKIWAEARIGGIFFATKSIPLSHEGLRYIIVTPHFRSVLLEWIGTWTDDQRREIFRDRDIKKLFVSDAEDIS